MMMVMVFMIMFPACISLCVFGRAAFYAPDPSGGSRCPVKIEFAGIQDIVKFYFRIVAFDDFGSRLECPDYRL